MEELDKIVEELGKLIAERLANTDSTFFLVVAGENTDTAYCTMEPELTLEVLTNVIAGIVTGQHRVIVESKKH